MAFQSVALASLTATYTDSEGEEDAAERDDRSSSSEKEKDTYTPKSSPKVNNDTGGTRNPVAKLVSYNDDLIVSEDDDLNEQDIPKNTIELAPDENDVQLPPEPTGRCSNELQEKIARYHEKMIACGLDMNYEIQQRKEFRNPSIYEKLIQYCQINELGTNFSPAVYDPLSWGKESFYEELDKVQRAEMARREKERKEKTKVEFVVGMAKRSGGGSNPGSGTEDDSKRRKSKWDQVGSNLAAIQTVRPATLLQQSALTTTATGTKSTVISAFGSLPKKPRV
ncbi:SAP30-binding protein [Lycorma delicatula]|uniref:SAP30-binding protein n=1 Tax=Lycorma delicatula TaxID=130591 RepID=UPI003F50E71A